MAVARPDIQPIEVNFSLKGKIYEALKDAITSMNIYAEDAELRLDERLLSEQLGVSRTPVREAMARLEQEGLLHIIPRRGAFVVRKTKQEIIEMIIVWSALEALAARLVTENASDQEIGSLRRMFTTFGSEHGDNDHGDNDHGEAKIDEYSDTNIEFHRALFRMSHNQLLEQITENLFVHMRSIRMRTIAESNRARRSIIDHMNIIEALEQRDAALADRLARQHTLDLAAHVETNVHYLD